MLWLNFCCYVNWNSTVLLRPQQKCVFIGFLMCHFHAYMYTLYCIYILYFSFVCFHSSCNVVVVLNFGIFRLSFVSIDCRFITLFAIASCHDWMTLFRSRYSSYVFFFYLFSFLLLNNVECMMWSVIFEIDKSLCCEGESLVNKRIATEKQRRKKKNREKNHTKHISPQIVQFCFQIVNWISLFLSCWNDDLVALVIPVVQLST